MTYLIGIDVGSSDCKVMAINASGQIVASAAHSYPTRYPHPGWAEQNPDDWYQAACTSVQAVLQTGNINPQQIVGLSVDGPAHNVALMDEAGAVIYPTIHWSDLRSTPQSERLAATYGDRIQEISCCRVNPSWTLTQLLWLKEHEPALWQKLRRILVTKDYVRYRFTGIYQTDVYDAIGTQLYDVMENCWSAELCGLIGLPVDWLPLVTRATQISGGLTEATARDTGLCAGTPVAVGSGDSVVEAFGIGVVQPGDGLVKLGTAANVNLVTVRPLPSTQTITYRHVVEPCWFSITPTNSGASTMRWFRDTFCRYESEQASKSGISVYELIDELAHGTSPGSEGLLFHPYLMGERAPYWDPLLRGDFVGIRAGHRLGHFARAILEGVAFSIRDCLAVVEGLGQPVHKLYLIGGGIKSKTWRQILADVTGQRLFKPTVEDAAYGSALLAGVAVGVFPDIHTAPPVQIEAIIEPNPAYRSLYDSLYVIYRDITRDLTSHSHRLATLSIDQSSWSRA